MAIDPITGTSSPAAVLGSKSNQGIGQDEFLKLLVAQLSNQDPLSPMDQEQFLAQLAQFSTVEGVRNIQTSQTRLQASSLLGQEVEIMTYEDGFPTVLNGPVTSVRWDNEGIFLSIKGSEKEFNMDEVSAVHWDKGRGTKN